MDIDGQSSELPLYFCVLEWSFLWRMQSLAIILKDSYEEQNPATPNWDSVNISNGLTIPNGWLSFVHQHGRFLFTKQNSLGASWEVPHLCQIIDLSHFIRVIPRAFVFLLWIFCTELSPTFSRFCETCQSAGNPCSNVTKWVITVQKILIYNITFKNCNCLPDTSTGSKKHQHLFTWHKWCFCTLLVSHFGKTNKSKE